MYLIKTSAGTGSPGYLDDNAPNGKQWISASGVRLKVPENTQVDKTGKCNDYNPPFCEIRIENGVYIGEVVWVKSTHLVQVTEPEETLRLLFQKLEQEPEGLVFTFKKLT